MQNGHTYSISHVCIYRDALTVCAKKNMCASGHLMFMEQKRHQNQNKCPKIPAVSYLIRLNCRLYFEKLCLACCSFSTQNLS